ncbi:MAG: hypothetical protein E7445_00010 [Ruminococcaceae bacterium]|nr:hypothetical protein [Oscillospiraceae bacterium]
MKEGNQTFSTWFQHVRKHIRFKPDHAAIERELSAHYEDHCQDLRRLGYEELLAQKRAVLAMGDPVQVGKALDAAHKPWLGWLWVISKVLCIAAVFVAVMYSLTAGPLSGPITEIFQKNDSRTWDGDYTRVREIFFTYEDAIAEPWFHSAIQIATGKGTQSIERAGYTITVPYAEVWERTIGDGRTERFYIMVLTAKDRYFWDDRPKYLTDHLTLQDACGRIFDKNYYHYTLDEEGKAVWPSDGYLRAYSVERNAFSSTWFMGSNVIVQSGDLGESAELQYPYGTPWTLPICWEEVPHVSLEALA